MCNNTRGSYNCTCNPGYHGDGQNCEGKITVKFCGLAHFDSEPLNHFKVRRENFLAQKCKNYNTNN